MTDTALSPVKRQKARADRAWQLNAAWDHITYDVHDYVLPYRRTGGAGTRKELADVLFDMTGPTSAMHLAGQLQRLLFSQPPKLQAGPLARQGFAAQGKQGLRDLDALDRALERTGEFIYPFMQAGDLDTATHEMCIDLGVGTGVLIPMRGTPDQPVIFHAPAAHEVALFGDMYGRTSGMSWKRMVQMDGLMEAFPKGNFATQFTAAARQTPSTEVCLYQDFWREPDGTWAFGAYLDHQHCHEFIAFERYRTQPFSAPRYHRVAGEMRGRGPILLALPAIKVQNKAQELVLKSASLQMIGIWGYRANSGFNPDTAPMEPGVFWAMQSTGGILGPDITRLDPASARFDIASMLLEGNAQQIREALMDTRLQQSPGTPKSASEIAALMQQSGQIHMGGFHRLWREVHPVIVPRCAEILASFGYLRGLMDFNQLLVSVGVRSPMAAAIEADRTMNIARYAEMMNALVGPQKLTEHLRVDEAADEIAEAMQIPKRLVPDGDEREQIRKALAEQQQQAVMSEMAVKAAPNLAAGALQVIDGGRQAA